MPDTALLLALLIAGLTLLLTPAALVLMRQLEVVDYPVARSSHIRPTVRGAGLAPALVLAAAIAVQLRVAAGGEAFGPWTGLAICVGGFAVLGLTEDLLGVPPLPRFAAQILLGAVAAPWLLTGPAAATVYSGRGELVLLAGLVAVWISAYANAFNFMDGINGIAALSAIVAGAAWFVAGSDAAVPVVGLGGLAVAAAALGFLPFNFPRPVVFLGDVGSYLFGAAMGALVIAGLVAGVPAEALVAPLLLPLGDTGLTLVRRVVRREAWYRPHRDHVYQRLVALGWSHARTTVTFTAALILCALLGLVSTTDLLALRILADLGLLVVTLGYLVSPRLIVQARLNAGRRPVPGQAPHTAPAQAYERVRDEVSREAPAGGARR